MDASLVELDENVTISTKSGAWNIWLKVSFDANDGVLGEPNTDPLLVLNVENLESRQQWKGRYTAPYLEELTRKTGNYKRFPVLMEMLLDAAHNARRPNSLVARDAILSLDILTAADLQALRHSVNKPSTARPKTAADRVYLILTYAVAFDRVHYPFPLVSAVEEAASQFRESQAALSAQLRTERDARHQLTAENKRLHAEIGSIKATVKQLETERNALQSKVAVLQRDRDGFILKGKAESGAQLRQLQAQFDQLVAKMNALSSKSESPSKSTRPALETQVGKLQSQMSLLLRELKLQNAAQFRMLDDRGLYVAQLEAKLAKLGAEQGSRGRPRTLAASSPRASLTAASKRSNSANVYTTTKAHAVAPLSKGRRAAAYTPPRSAYSGVARGITLSVSPAPRARVRSTSQSSTASSTKSARSTGSFKRFDPTAYVQEKQAKMEEKRRIASLTASPSPSFRRTIFSDSQERPSSPRKLQLSETSFREPRSRADSPSYAASLIDNYNFDSKSIPKAPKTSVLLDPDLTTERIDQRLQKLDLFLKMARNV